MLWSKVKRFWWWLWTGDADEAATRRRIEQDVRRFGGTVRWAPVDADAEILELLSDCANALDEVLPPGHPYRRIAAQAKEAAEGSAALQR